MNSTLRTVLVFVLLVGAVLFASVVYRRATTGGGARPVDTSPQPVDEASLDPELRVALDALREGQEEDAIRHFRAIPTDSKNYPTALRNLAILTARQGRHDEAVASLLKLVSRHPGDPEVHASLGWVFYLGGRYEEAELAALRTLELNPEHLATRYNIGLYRIAQGRTQLAISSYIRAMHADPSQESATRNRDRLRDFHDQHPNLPAPHYALAFFADSMQDPRTEIEELEHYLGLDVSGAEKEAATKQLEEARAEVGGA